MNGVFRFGCVKTLPRVVRVFWPKQREIPEVIYRPITPLSDAQIAEAVAIAEEIGIEKLRILFIEHREQRGTIQLPLDDFLGRFAISGWWGNYLEALGKISRLARGLRVDLNGERIYFGSKSYEVKTRHSLIYVQALIDANGKFVTKDYIELNYCRPNETFNTTKARKKLPPEIQELIEVIKGPGKGSRLKLPA